MRKYKKYTREECSKKFDDLMMNTFNYVMQEGEQIVQCKEPYPAYWFMSNKGYLFSAYGNKIKVVKPNHRYTGTKNKDGSRTGQDWYYEYKVKGQKHNKHVSMYRVMSDCFLENEFGSDDNEIHHIRKKNQYKPSEGKECNRADNLQLLPSCHVPGMLFTSVLFFLCIIIRILPDSVSVSFLHPEHALPLLYLPHSLLLLSYT